MCAPKEMYNNHCDNICIFCTGASSGIGRATAVHFASLGARVVISGRNADSIQVSDAVTLNYIVLRLFYFNIEKDPQ